LIEGRELGWSMTGVVRLLEDRTVRVRLAVKTISLNVDKQRRFEREVVISKRLKHSSVVKILMEYVSNGILKENLDHLKEHDPMNVIIIVENVIDMRFMHSSSLLHRYLKPSNILLYQRRRVRLTDFSHSIFTDSDCSMTGEFGTTAPDV
jgi:serine/threonine protein kinase